MSDELKIALINLLAREKGWSFKTMLIYTLLQGMMTVPTFATVSDLFGSLRRKVFVSHAWDQKNAVIYAYLKALRRCGYFAVYVDEWRGRPPQ